MGTQEGKAFAEPGKALSRNVLKDNNFEAEIILRRIKLKKWEWP